MTIYDAVYGGDNYPTVREVTENLEELITLGREEEAEWLVDSERAVDPEEVPVAKKLIDELYHFNPDEVMVSDNNFKDYAQDVAEEHGLEFNVWPATCIDWEKAVTELKADCSNIEIGGTTFWVSGSQVGDPKGGEEAPGGFFIPLCIGGER